MKLSADSTSFRCGPAWATGNTPPENGTQKTVDGQRFVFYDGYWIRYYQPPAETLEAKKNLIESLTRRTFHHTEHGINTPGHALDSARAAHEEQTDPRQKRVNAAMLAVALSNRATDIFRTVVDLGANGVHISRDNELMQECGQCFKEALELGTQVKHYSGQEGIDELWGEPFRAFTVPISQFYESRFIKVAQAMKNIDQIADSLKASLHPHLAYNGADWHIDHFATAAKYECETMRSDAQNNFRIWPQFVAAGELLAEFQGQPYRDPGMPAWLYSTGSKLIFDGKSLIEWVALARVPMPVSTELFIQECSEFDNAIQAVRPMPRTVSQR